MASVFTSSLRHAKDGFSTTAIRQNLKTAKRSFMNHVTKKFGLFGRSIFALVGSIALELLGEIPARKVVK
jgi:RAB protein geranylgeranyltransferase component A